MSKASKKIVLITGCSEGGIGHYLALGFLSHGCTVYGSVRNLAKVPSTFAEKGIHVVQLDVLSDDSVTEAVKDIIGIEGRIDVLINNAGCSCTTPIIDADIEFARDAFETNVFGIIRVTKAVAPYMIKQKSGVISNVGSVAGYASVPWTGIYSSTKAAVHSISDALRVELSPFGVSVVVIAPGIIRSNIGNHYKINLPSGSVYTPMIDKIRLLTMSTSLPTSTNGDVFAKIVVPKVLRPNPPPYITCGKGSRIVWYMYYLPPTIKDYILSKVRGVERLRDVTGVQRSLASLFFTSFLLTTATAVGAVVVYKKLSQP